MREIKFRAWDKGHNVMREIQKMSFKNGKMMTYKWSMWFGEETLSEPMQYTGLKDKNGKEIYEGDYLTVSGYNYDEPEGDWEGEVSMNEMEIGIFGICCDTGDKGFFPLREIGGEYRTIYEVVGNIYENPELLKECEIDD